MLFNIFSDFSDSAAEMPCAKLPSGQIENGGQVVSADPSLVELASDGWTIKQKIEALKKELKVITDKLENTLGAGSTLTVHGLCKATISGRERFVLIDPDRARALLGGRFDDLVNSSVSYTLTDKLKALVSDPDEPLAEPLRGCVAVEYSTSVAFRAAARAA